MVIFLCSQCCDVWRYVCAVSLQCATVLWMCHSWCVVKYSGVCCMQFLCSFIPGEDNWVWTPSALQSNKFACTQMWSTFMYQCLPAINVYQGNRITSTAEDTRIVFSAFHHAVTAVQCAILTHPIMLLNGCLTPPLTTYICCLNSKKVALCGACSEVSNLFLRGGIPEKNCALLLSSR